LVRVLGIDPGTSSFDLCGLQDGNVFLDLSIPTSDVSRNPEMLVGMLKSVGPLDLVVGPSGHGLPLTRIRRVGNMELSLLALVRPDDTDQTIRMGLRNLLGLLRETDLEVYVIPGVKHLPTVPTHRKVNKIDMGTADKLCSTALGIFDQSRHHGIDLEDTSFILAELGFGYNAFIAVEKGQIVDGIGGTTAPAGFLSSGSVDAEAAYLLKGFTRNMLLQGGVAYVAGMKTPSPEEFAAKVEENAQYRVAWEMLVEGIVKAVVSLKVSVEKPREILMAGRLSRIDRVYTEVTRRLSGFGEVRKIQGLASVAKEASQGAALLADGLAGGYHRRLIECLKLKDAGGSILDYVYLEGAEDLRRSFGV